MQYSHRYDDIISLPHHKSKRHPPMSIYARSAQFAPFAALTGYEDAVRETARETHDRINIDDDLKSILDAKLQILKENINKKSEITFTYFVPDIKKDGGEYITVIGVVKEVDAFKQMVILVDKREIPIGDIIDISGDIFSRVQN